jgi:hypothetical protein
MAETLKIARAVAIDAKAVAAHARAIATEACADIAKSVGGVTMYVTREQYWVLGVTAYLMTSFVTGNVMSAVYNIYQHSVA